jgi:hypothetical protein
MTLATTLPSTENIRPFVCYIDCTKGGKLPAPVASALRGTRAYVFFLSESDARRLRQDREGTIRQVNGPGFVYHDGWLYIAPKHLLTNKLLLESKIERHKRQLRQFGTKPPVYLLDEMTMQLRHYVTATKAEPSNVVPDRPVTKDMAFRADQRLRFPASA